MIVSEITFEAKKHIFVFLLLRRMTGRPEFFIVESDINKEYFPSTF